MNGWAIHPWGESSPVTTCKSSDPGERGVVTSWEDLTRKHGRVNTSPDLGWEGSPSDLCVLLRRIHSDRSIRAELVLQALRSSLDHRRLLSITLQYLLRRPISRIIRQWRSWQVPSRLLHRFAKKSSLSCSHWFHQSRRSKYCT
jgi:hypothetical protein